MALHHSTGNRDWNRRSAFILIGAVDREGLTDGVALPASGPGAALQLREGELALLKQVQQLMGEVEIPLVDFINQQHPRQRHRQKGRAHWTKTHVVLHGEWCRAIRGGGIRAEKGLGCHPGDLQILQTAQRVIGGQGIREGCPRRDRPLQHRPQAEPVGHRIGQGGFARARQAGEQQGTSQAEGGIHRQHKVAAGIVGRQHETGGAGAGADVALGSVGQSAQIQPPPPSQIRALLLKPLLA